MAERDTLQHKNGWLNDLHMSGAQNILHRQFPFISSLQDTIKPTFDAAPQQAEFVQILNTNGLHWLTAGNIGCNVDEVNVFDSLFRSINEDTKE